MHLGFLQYKHRYEVKFSIPDPLGEEVIAEPSAFVKLEEIRPAESGKHMLKSFKTVTFQPILSLFANFISAL